MLPAFRGQGISRAIMDAVMAHTLLGPRLGLPPLVVFQRMNSGMSVFSMLAIPFFIYSGDLMVRGGIAGRIDRFGNGFYTCPKALGLRRLLGHRLRLESGFGTDGRFVGTGIHIGNIRETQ